MYSWEKPLFSKKFLIVLAMLMVFGSDVSDVGSVWEIMPPIHCLLCVWVIIQVMGYFLIANWWWYRMKNGFCEWGDMWWEHTGEILPDIEVWNTLDHVWKTTDTLIAIGMLGANSLIIKGIYVLLCTL